MSTPGNVGWHELYAADGASALAFYADQFGWHKTDEMDHGPDGQISALLDWRQRGGRRHDDQAAPRFRIPPAGFYFVVGNIARRRAPGDRQWWQVLNRPHGGARAGLHHPGRRPAGRHVRARRFALTEAWMFEQILIANRGEIACRVMRTARRLGVRHGRGLFRCRCHALHVAMADEAVAYRARRRPPKAICAATRSSRRRCAPAPRRSIQAMASSRRIPTSSTRSTAAGLVFIGPSAASIRAMGLKDAAKRLMEKAGVPVVPGYHGEDQEIVAAGRQGPGDRLSGADQGARRRRRQGHAPRRPSRTTSPTRWPAPAARPRPPSATIACWSRNMSPSRAISRCRSSATITATSSISSSATARRSAATRR